MHLQDGLFTTMFLPTGRVTLIYVTPPVLNDYRTIATGNWSAASVATTWQRYNGSAWVAATVAPSST